MPHLIKRKLVLLVVLGFGCVLALVAYSTIQAENTHKIEAQKAAEERQELLQIQQAQAEEARAAEQTRRQKEEEEVAHQDRLRRCNVANGLSAIMRFKMGENYRIYPTDLADTNMPQSIEQLEHLEFGDCRRAIFFSVSDAAITATAFNEEVNGAQRTLILAGFRKVAFADSTTYCQASLAPYPLGVGEIRCSMR